MYNNSLHFHFTGIGGSGMSGLAEIILSLGFSVSGSDLKLSESCERLSRLGAVIVQGHQGSNVPEETSALVFSSAVLEDNPEIIEAKARNIPVISRAEVLAELMRLKFSVGVAGSHGKTTTTSFIAAILEHAGLDPTVIIGGQVKAIGTGGKLGKGDFLVAETDESDRSFLLLKPTIAVITNIDAEHLCAYSSLTDLEESFDKFLEAVPFYGVAILCVDDKRVRDLSLRYNRRSITYGVSPDAMVRAENILFKNGVVEFDVVMNGSFLCPVKLPMPGRHFVLNALASIIVGLEFGVCVPVICEALSSFSGVSRRMERVGSVGDVSVYSDYGHHPTEIKATLAAFKEGLETKSGQLKVIFQPHRYTRTRDCFVEFIDAFSQADELILSDIYSAGEMPIDGVTGEKFFSAVIHPNKRFVEKIDYLPQAVLKTVRPGDTILCLGAGPIGTVPQKILEALSIINDESKQMRA